MPRLAIAPRLLDSLQSEAMQLRDDMRGYFESGVDGVSQRTRVAVGSEALRATTRLMQVIGWLSAERSASAEQVSHMTLSDPAAQDAAPARDFPSEARRLIQAATDLHRRVRSLAASPPQTDPVDSPVRSLLQRLEKSL
jgi:regulator of CtrA degradation